MLLKSKINTQKSANIVLGNWSFKMIETKYEYFNTHSKHFVGSKNPFFFVFVLIWYFNGIGSRFNSISLS